MLDCGVSFATTHPNISYWLDEGIKLGALILGGLWTFWNYRKSRTYAQKLDLQITGDVFFSGGLYIDVTAVLTNLGASKHLLQPEGTSCEIVAILKDMSQQDIRLFPVFPLHTYIEPGESINDHLLWHIQAPPADIVWLKINLRVVSGKVEWNRTSMVRVQAEDKPTYQ
jgi:hypothetical protein